MRRVRPSSVVMVAMLLVGVGLLLYPTVSNLYNQVGASYAVKGYEDHTQEMTQEERDRLLGEAEEYNAGLLERAQAFRAGEPHDPTYASLLDTQGDGMIGFLTIDKIGVQLPVYHGTSDEVLAKSIGHLEGSSLPVGGPSTHAVLSGHRGLPSATLFTDLDRMEEGDKFVLTVVGRKMTYQVDSIKVVEPDQVEALAIVPGEDRVTLLTCTPYAVNTQRLLVSGIRVPNGPEPVHKLEGPSVRPLAVAFALAAVAVVATLLALLLRRRRRRAPGPRGRHLRT